MSQPQRVQSQTDSQSQPQPLQIPPAELLAEYSAWTVQAPMVRYSKLPFRELCGGYNTHITYTPMMLSTEFSRSEYARASDFSTSSSERGVFELRRRRTAGWHDEAFEKHSQLTRGALIAQFAASEPVPFMQSAELIAPYVDAIDLNTGCPTSWAYAEGIGGALLRRPETVRDIIRTTHDRLGSSLPVTVKIRIDQDEKRTEQLIRNAVAAGVSLVGIHGRYRTQASTSPVNLDGVRLAQSFSDVPTISNGDAWSLDESLRIRDVTGCNGVMSARGILSNPAMFAGYNETPMECVDKFINLAIAYGLPFPLFHRHLAYMLESRMSKSQRLSWHTLHSIPGALDWIHEQPL
ncbi:tRNA-dihydrouridine(20a/20b) synthase [Wallemia ichthyophaga EXF-994]|uniref:tRNA-dihydrouridine synthase n=1 Tax=Wallemia ichthyophaga (strain EXF-994 / CBS 113033) TaxID=1299270 RepID=R9AJ32_WALI9|nr:tRNA-dihydrouridine(20a/20b) synthase [Wallemia ichthyophaga EXF-994]TIA69242.1 hypothetical protein E3P91_03699 [Wallemia ichthyophaga]EOR02125.1 tRNA-dihydrouridine(20a/20b) synthase [Wallemia ichthyophaga EXF-994]TIB29490.1 hypothetical protein E3P84_03683 [Wallemia ichthyophaga]TIB39111.1 hypothetical protein E3P83_03655 [Wallemia ichthyophaga]TIB59064.1 hypothetical protein E3P78_03679 [Wallemia ichthyophaga]